jgi:hypothetical protein
MVIATPTFALTQSDIDQINAELQEIAIKPVEGDTPTEPSQYNFWKGQFDPMTTADWQLQTALIILQIADWGQTRDIATNTFNGAGWNDETKEFYYFTNYRKHETNPILGNHPSIGEVNCYFVAYIIATTVGTYIIPQKYRPYWQCFFILDELYFVSRNAKLGIKMKF